MTLTLELSPLEELGLAEMARQEGVAPAEAAHRLLAAHLPAAPRREREQALVQEYQALTAQERQGRLSAAQAAHRQEIEAALDELERQDPKEQEADERLRETGDKLDEMLTLLRSLPRKNTEQ